MPGTATPDRSDAPTVHVHARFPEDLIALVDQVAEEEERSRSQVLRRAVERGLSGRVRISNEARSA
jgi:metal-responsive CopG/Arc/MetJ family transcriptional regulator